MIRTVIKKRWAVGVVALGIAIAIPFVASAIPVRAQEAQANAEEVQTTTQQNAADRKAAAQTRLANAKLRACQNREKAITNIMLRLADRGQKQADLFSTIAERTEQFYVDGGKTLANYDALVADVAAKKSVAQNAVDEVKSTSGQFQCDGNNPKGVATTFKDDLKSEIKALNDFKTSVKNLIVGVKSVQGTTSSVENGGAN